MLFSRKCSTANTTFGNFLSLVDDCLLSFLIAHFPCLNVGHGSSQMHVSCLTKVGDRVSLRECTLLTGHVTGSTTCGIFPTVSTSFTQNNLASSPLLVSSREKVLTALNLNLSVQKMVESRTGFSNNNKADREKSQENVCW